MKNKVTITGNVGKKPKVLGGGKKALALSFSIAVNQSKKNPETSIYHQTGTNWFDVVAFGEVAKAWVDTLQKGNLVTVNGSLQSSKYTNAAGITKTSVQILAQGIELVELRKKPEVIIIKSNTTALPIKGAKLNPKVVIQPIR